MQSLHRCAHLQPPRLLLRCLALLQAAQEEVAVRLGQRDGAPGLLDGLVLRRNSSNNGVKQTLTSIPGSGVFVCLCVEQCNSALRFLDGLVLRRMQRQ